MFELKFRNINDNEIEIITGKSEESVIELYRRRTCTIPEYYEILSLVDSESTSVLNGLNEKEVIINDIVKTVNKYIKELLKNPITKKYKIKERTVDVKRYGKDVIEKLLEENIIKNVSDIFYLDNTGNIEIYIYNYDKTDILLHATEEYSNKF